MLLQQLVASRRLLSLGGPDRAVRAAAIWGCPGGRKIREVVSEQVRLVPKDNVSKLVSQLVGSAVYVSETIVTIMLESVVNRPDVPGAVQ